MRHGPRLQRRADARRGAGRCDVARCGFATNPQAGCRTQPVWCRRAGLLRDRNRPADAARERSPGARRRTRARARWGAQNAALRARRDLHGETAPFDGIVVADPAFLPNAQDVAHPAAAVGDKSAAGLGRGHRKGGVVGRPIGLGEPAVGCRDRRDAGQRQLLWQPVLQALGPSTCSGRAPRANRPRCGGCRAVPGRARREFVRSSAPPPRPWGYGNSGCPGRCRARRTARADRLPRPARQSSTPCPPPRRESPNRPRWPRRRG